MSYIPDRIEDEAYSWEKLKGEDKGFIECLNELTMRREDGLDFIHLDDLTENVIDMMDINEESIIGKMQIETIKLFVEELKQYLYSQANEINCSFLESGRYEDEGEE